MCRPSHLTLVATILAATTCRPADRTSKTEQEPLFDNLGSLHHEITTKSPEAQAFFDQGLRLTYGFNHAEAIRSFTEATRLDPDCAMCYWGIAYANGPNINAPMEPDQVAPAWDALQQAVRLAPESDPRDRAYIDALATRYSSSKGADRAALDSAYAGAMRKLWDQYPDDPDAGALFAESMLDLRPWHQWTADGTPEPGTVEVVAALEEVIKDHPEHPGSCHYYIHAVEASLDPGRALPCAERLPGLMPGAGHLVHMPAHIYMRLGRYDDAAQHNMHAVKTDELYIEGQHPKGIYPLLYYPHNYHFLWAALMMDGQSAKSIEAARQVAAHVPLEAVRQIPPFEFFLPTPYFALARFSRWDEILKEPPPPADLRYTTAMWYYARGLALIAKNELGPATAARDSVAAILAATPADQWMGLQTTVSLLGIALHVLDGEIALKRGNPSGAVKEFQVAVTMQDALNYDEPPPWYYPVRESLGSALLAASRPKDAEAVFRADLLRNPNNGWSLNGLSQALSAQHRIKEAEKAHQEFVVAWERADVGVGE